jgi:D-cysteine desulfhydrase family pyridoxal phosphate-dependent enzyme
MTSVLLQSAMCVNSGNPNHHYAFEYMLDTIPRLKLADLPTPLEEAARLAKHLGISRLLIKRDDQTGLAMGGNKARKLEYDFAEIVKKGCDVVVTVGGAQSNHARMTAAAARRLGIDVKLVLGGPDIKEFQGNMLLDVVFGAEIRFLKGNDDNHALAAAMDEWVRELARKGRKPYAIPVGGSTGLGALGYVRAMRELAGQFGQSPVQIVLAVGSCGTLAGTILGTRLFMPQARVIGISVSRTSGQIALQTATLMRESAGLLNMQLSLSADDIETYDSYFQEYGAFTDSAKEAIITSARLEGILLDPVYTGKAMAGLFDLVRKGVINKNIPTIFVHTGGLPILFAYEPQFRTLASCTKF